MSRPALLFGPYQPLPIRTGDRATGLYRDADVVVTGLRVGATVSIRRSAP
jgi:hypothetical protein